MNEPTIKTKKLSETCFERAVFFSWSCHLEQCCTYCYMASMPEEKRKTAQVRSLPSLLAETIIIKECGWDYGFLSGGIGALPFEKIVELAKLSSEIMHEKIWINIGAIGKDQLIALEPYIKGVVGSVEVLDPLLHKKICPSKPLAPIEKMFTVSTDLGMQNAMTMIVGLGETIEDFKLLEEFIKKYHIVKIHLYGLNPQKGTGFENALPPTPEYQALWIKKTRETFPEIDIQCGIWENRTERISGLLLAGANSISKYPALKAFGGPSAFDIEEQARIAGRKFRGTLTKIPKVNWDRIIENINIDKKTKEDIKKKLDQYLVQMEKDKTKVKISSKDLIE